jgi:hypothetical protein
MLEELNLLPWSKLKVSDGTADCIPKAIESLLSDSEDTRDKGYWNLDNVIVLQGSLYEAAPHVIPFLLEILESPGLVHSKKEVYLLLTCLALGYDAPDSDASPEALRPACHEEILKGVDLYIGEIEDRESKYREYAADLLIALDESISRLSAVLDRLLLVTNQEDDKDLKTILEELIGYIKASADSGGVGSEHDQNDPSLSV